MEISRLFFSKETKEKLDKPISPQHKGKLRWERLKEAEANGALQHAKRRVDIGKIVGVEDYKTAYSWVSGLINRGAIVESILGFENGLPIHEYHLGTELKYTSGKRKAKNIQQDTQPIKIEEATISTKRLSRRQKGKLRWEKLMENVVDGKLVSCTSRNDIIKLVGYSRKEHHSGYSWVTNMITRNHLIEKRVGTDKRGMAIYEYKIGSQPNYRLGKKPAVYNVETAPILNEPATISEPVVLSRVNPDRPNIVITYGELRIEFNDTNADVIKDAIVALIDKVKE